MKKKSKVLLLLSLVVVTGLIIFSFKSKDVSASKDQSKKPGRNRTVPVTTILPNKGNFSTYITVSGSISARDTVDITPKATGRLNTLLVEEGSYVSKGQLIGELDHSDLDKQILQAESKVKIAQANLNLTKSPPLNPEVKRSEATIRQYEENLKELEITKKNLEVELSGVQNLYDKGLITQQQLNTSKTQVDITEQKIKSIRQQIESLNQSLKLVNIGSRPEEIEASREQVDSALAEVNVYKSQLSNYIITSPLSGVVTKKFLSQGSLVTQNTPIVTVTNTSNPQIILNIPENQIENIKIGQKVDIKTSNTSKNVYKAKISEIYPTIDDTTRLGKVRADMLLNNNLKLGMTLIGNIYTIEKINTLTLPTDAIIKDKNEVFVYTAIDNKAVKKNVVIGIEEPDITEVISGIKPTDRIVLRGNTFLKPGTSIEIESEVKKDINDKAKTVSGKSISNNKSDDKSDNYSKSNVKG